MIRAGGLAVAIAMTCGGIAIGSRSSVSATTQAGPVNPAPEVAIKAAVVANLPKFVEWPSNAFPSRTAPLAICVLGEDPLGVAIVAVFNEKRLGERPIIVSRVAKIEEIERCHVLYLSASEERRLDAILKAVGKQAVLTVGDMAKFAQHGGTVGLIVRENRVRFEINDRAARASGLRLSADLLRLAAAVIVN